jgi:MYXO-CTERM domain-containing protein
MVTDSGGAGCSCELGGAGRSGFTIATLFLGVVGLALRLRKRARRR